MRCNPAGPTLGQKRLRHGDRQEDRRYPRSCNPDRSRRPLTVEQQRLATRYLPMAKSMAMRVARDWATAADDFEAAACLALVEAVQSFDASRECNFATYARPHILGALYDLRREFYMSGCRIRRSCTRIPEFVGLGRDLEENHRIIDSGPAEAFEMAVDSRDLVESWIKRLPSKHAEVIRQIYLDGQSLQVTAQRFGCSPSLMSRLHREALGLLTEQFEKPQVA